VGTSSTSPLYRDFAAGPQWRLPFPSKNVSTPAPERLLAKLLYALVIRWTPYRQSCVVAVFGDKVSKSPVSATLSRLLATMLPFLATLSLVWTGRNVL